MANRDLRTDEGIEGWIRDHNPDGVSKILNAVMTNKITNDKAIAVTAYLNKMNAQAASINHLAQAHREERATAAAEKSAKWAGWAILISIAALAVASWPFVKEHFL